MREIILVLVWLYKKQLAVFTYISLDISLWHDEELDLAREAPVFSKNKLSLM